MSAPSSPAYVPAETITRHQWSNAVDVRPEARATNSAKPGVRYSADERRAREDPTADQAIADILGGGGFIVRETTLTVREIILPRRVTPSEAAAQARKLGLSERGGKWLVTPAVREALAGRALAEVLPGPQGNSRSAWPDDGRAA